MLGKEPIQRRVINRHGKVERVLKPQPNCNPKLRLVCIHPKPILQFRRDLKRPRTNELLDPATKRFVDDMPNAGKRTKQPLDVETRNTMLAQNKPRHRGGLRISPADNGQPRRPEKSDRLEVRDDAPRLIPTDTTPDNADHEFCPAILLRCPGQRRHRCGVRVKQACDCVAEWRDAILIAFHGREDTRLN